MTRTEAKMVAGLRRELADAAAENAALKAQLALPECSPYMPPAWAAGLTVNETTLMAALVEAYPRVLSQVDLDAIIPAHDHAVERDLKCVDVLVCKVRKKMGRDVIENLWGRGYRCSETFHAEAKGRVA